MHSPQLLKTVTPVSVDQDLRKFMMRVYNYVAIGLFITAITAYNVAHTPFYYILMGKKWSFYALIIACAGPIILVKKFLDRLPVFILQGLYGFFTLAMGVLMSEIFIVFSDDSILKVFFITASMFGATSIYGYTTKKDLTSMRSFLMTGLWGLIIASFINISMQSTLLSYAVSFISVFIFTGFIAYDTQNLRKIYASNDQTDQTNRKIILGALSLYISFINLFLALLELLGKKR